MLVICNMNAFQVLSKKGGRDPVLYGLIALQEWQHHGPQRLGQPRLGPQGHQGVSAASTSKFCYKVKIFHFMRVITLFYHQI